MKRVVLCLQYDGTPWQGWQTQVSGRTVQDRLELALQKFTLTDVQTHCAGRTDAGVHALAQVVHFDTAIEREASSWVRGLNAFLPPSIAVRWATEVTAQSPDGFHARFSAHARTYHYALYNHPVRAPLMVGKCGWAFRRLDADAMQRAAELLLGTHDFSAFRAVDCQAKSPVKTIHRIDLARRGDMIVFTLHANAFLHHMVRNIVGSLVYVGYGKYPPEWVAELLHAGDRSRAAPTFMADGLYLAKIDYDPQWQLPVEAGSGFPWL
ncbi:MAG: tRNA pseudouridine(38-40) synthase TruA [Herminiimonas sp.]|nr:tRNA pseudouridine(38-40) synthase TruA [Herminiimonas sp.]